MILFHFRRQLTEIMTELGTKHVRYGVKVNKLNIVFTLPCVGVQAQILTIYIFHFLSLKCFP